jgi:cyanate permease
MATWKQHTSKVSGWIWALAFFLILLTIALSAWYFLRKNRENAKNVSNLVSYTTERFVSE